MERTGDRVIPAPLALPNTETMLTNCLTTRPISPASHRLHQTQWVERQTW